MKKQIIFTILLFLVSIAVLSGYEEITVFKRLLYSKNLDEQQKAFYTIVENNSEYADLVLKELEFYSNNPDKTPDALLYLAAFLRDQRYIEPLSKLISNNNYSSNHCLYDCPIVFSLAIFSSFTNYHLPVLDDRLIAVKDLKSELRKLKLITLEPENARKLAMGPGIDPLFDEMEDLPLSDVFNIAGPGTLDGSRRYAAAIIILANTIDDQHIKELYWLAIMDIPKDASAGYRHVIHQAIYKAETHKKKKKS